MMTGSLPEITVCICTFKRPELLRRLLAELQRQQTGGLFRYSVVVVDNDASESARPVVEDCAGQGSVPLRYAVEPEQNIALARNRAVGMAAGEFLAFIDDDEYPGDLWLGTLFEALTRSGADAVLGPVVPYFLSPPPRWVVTTRMFVRPRPPSGTVLQWWMTRTGNVLLRRELFGEGFLFRPEYGSGGEDRDCFRRMIGAGKRFVWCDEAPVYEAVTADRCRATVQMRRALLRGKSPYNHGARAVFTSELAIPAYALALPVLLVLRRDLFVRTLIRSCDHVGRILSVLGFDVIREKYIS